MSNFSNPLDSVRVASPCPANWNEMIGDERKRYCSECKLNVYNLSDMTQREAENFLLSSEGRVCVKFYRRSDGTVLTRDCPVGWAKIKRKISRVATAVFAAIAGFLGGNFVSNLASFNTSDFGQTAVPAREISLPGEHEISRPARFEPVNGGLSNLDEIKSKIKKTESKKTRQKISGWLKKFET